MVPRTKKVEKHCSNLMELVWNPPEGSTKHIEKKTLIVEFDCFLVLISLYANSSSEIKKKQ
jgi:hypothetical protein